MNKYDIMSSVIPPMTVARMASGGGFKPKLNFSKLLSHIIDPLEEADWLKGIQDLIQEKGGVMKQYLPDWMAQDFMFKHKHPKGEHDYHPLNVKKEMFWDPEAIQKTKEFQSFGKTINPGGGVKYGKAWEPVPYTEYDAFADMFENLLYKNVGDQMVDEKSFKQYDDMMQQARDAIQELKKYQGMYDAAPPQYKADVGFELKGSQEKVERILGVIKDAIGSKEYPKTIEGETLNSRGGLHGYAAGGSFSKYFVREPVKKAGKFLKDNIPPVFEKFAEYLPKISGAVQKYSTQLNPVTKLWDVGTATGKKKIEVDGKWVKNPDYFKATETGFKDQASANKQVKKLQKQQVGTVTKPDKAEGALVWKSRESIVDAPFQIAPKKQWLDYLLSRGVGYKELSDTSLFLTKSGLAKDGETPIRIPEGGFLHIGGDTRISKADFLKEFDELVPKIKVHLLGNRNFSDGLKYIQKSLTARPLRKSGRYGDEDAGMAKYYLDYSRADFDPKFEGVIKQISSLVNRLREEGSAGGRREEEGSKAFKHEMVENVVDQINATFKAQYGIDNVIGKGVNQLEHPNLPFEVVKLGNNLSDVFSKRGIQYRVLGQPQHEGDQILEGGYNHNELVFTFEPGKMRAGEVGTYKPTHEFGLGKDAEGGFVHARISDRIDEAGRKILFVEEIQSDMHQAVQNKNSKYKPRLDRPSPGMEKIKELKDLTKILKKELKNVQKNLEKAQSSETRGRTPEEIDMRQNLIDELTMKRDTMIKEMEGQAEDIAKLEGASGKGGTIPEGPFKMSKDYAKFVIKYLLKMARENGYDGVAVANAWIKSRKLSAGAKDFEGHFGFYGNWGLPDPAVPASFKDVILKDAMGEVSRDSKTKLALTAIKDHEKGKTWGDIPVLLLTKGKIKEIISEAAERIDKGQSAYYKGGLVREVFQDVVPVL